MSKLFAETKYVGGKKPKKDEGGLPKVKEDEDWDD